MESTPRRLPVALVAVLVAASLAANASPAAASSSTSSSDPSSSVAGAPREPGPGQVLLAQAEGEAPRELQPRYEPVPPQEPDAFNDEYVFGLTRGIADSALHPVAKIVLFPITVPLDIALLPFEVIGGFF